MTMTADDELLSSRLRRLGDDELDDAELDRRVIRFQGALRRLRDDPAEATRIDVLVTAAELGQADAAVGRQGTLFDDDEIPGMPGSSDSSGQADADPGEIGYRGPTACSAAGITYRMLDYWARTGLVEPSVRAAGSGSQRLYSFRDILVLKVVKRLLDAGISLQQIRAVVQHLRDRHAPALAQVTLISDGVSVYECTSANEVVDLLQGGQEVFGIALGLVWREIEGDLAVLPAVRAEDGFVAGASETTVPTRTAG
jgi:DNA-binding transcriptional MerR regulator